MVERWQMNKLGFVNFWYFDWEEFYFSHGRLLLRGENGAGKSITTQSFIPFMLDGDLHPYRLDAFGSKDRKMDYYLLGDEKEENTGYLYLEFVNTSHTLYRTLVVGLRARRGKPTDFWGFCLSDGRRIGNGEGDFPLFGTHGKQRISLSRQEVHNQFGDGENWVEKSSEYKQMVNRMLFGCREAEQYDRLLKLLIDIRKPKLSKNFSPNLVRDILNDSLQPLGEEDIAPMINSMEKMDDIQARLDNLKISLNAARQLRNEYKRYNDFVLGKKGEKYLDARQNAEKLLLDAQQLQEKVTHTEADLKTARIRQADAKLQKQEFLHEYTGLRQDGKLDAWHSRLNDLRADQNENGQKIISEQNREQEKQRDLSAKESALQRENRQYDDLHSELQRAFGTLSALNSDVAYPDHPVSLKELDLDLQRPALKEYAGRLRKTLDLLRQSKTAQDRLDEAQREWDSANTTLQHEQKQLSEAQALVLRERDALCAAFAELENDALPFRLTGTLLQNLFKIIEQYKGRAEEQSIERLLSGRLRELETPLNNRKAELRQSLTHLQTEWNDLHRQKKELEAQSELSPPRSPAVEATRALLRQRGIPHASFYELVDFDSALSPAVRAMLEAQLHDAGILDALILPEEARVEIETVFQSHPDHFLRLENTPAAGHPLPLHAETSAPAWAGVDDLLCRLSSQESGNTFFAPNGHYRQGILQGYSVPDGEARYIGASARQANRARQIARLEERLSEKLHEIHETQDLLQSTEHALTCLDEGYRHRPNTQDLAESLDLMETRRAQVERCEQLLDDRQTQLRRCRQQLDSLRAQFLPLAQKMPYAQTADAYDAASQAFEEYKECFERIHTDKSKLEVQQAVLNGIRREIDTLNEGLLEANEHIRTLEAQQRKTQAEINALQAKLNDPEMRELSQKLEALRQNIDAAEEQIQSAEKTITRCETDLEHWRPDLEKTNALAQRAIETKEHRRMIFEEELLRAPGHPEPQNVSLSHIAQQAKNAIRQNDRSQTHESLRASLEKNLRGADVLNAYRITLDSLFPSEDDELRNRACIHLDLGGQKLDLLVFIRRIDEQIKADSALLSEEDRRLFETILNQTVTTKLSHRINSSQDWAVRMSGIMEQLSTSMGLRFSLAWKGKPADQQEELATRELVELLRKDPAVMGDADREKITGHFRAKIEKARELSHNDATPATYSELMRQALDFRTWFEFRLFYQRGEQPKKELTNSAFNSFSGGEKAMAMYIPLFAALSAQYSSAETYAPHLMALDEAFAGVDEKNIESMFYLVHQLELDYIMNSQALWGCYPTVDSLNIAELWRPQDADVVTVIRYHWDGRIRRMEDL